eukprot:Nk52_evm16s2085 gene=Nk52_evmTU16s2085
MTEKGQVEGFGEHEAQDCVWLAWAQYSYTKRHSVHALQLQILSAVVLEHQQQEGEEDFLHVVVVCASREWEEHFWGCLGTHITTTAPDSALESVKRRVRTLVIPHSEFWLRDTGPTFVRVKEEGARGTLRRLGMAGFKFNFWGMEAVTSKASREETLLPQRVCEVLSSGSVDSSSSGIVNVGSSDIVSEGGGRELNGGGDMMAMVPLEIDRNGSSSMRKKWKKEHRLGGKQKKDAEGEEKGLKDFLKGLEAEYGRLLGVKQVIWLPHTSVYDDRYYFTAGDQTGFCCHGHIDGWARFAGEDTILYQRVEEVEGKKEEEREEARRMRENLAVLKRARVWRTGKPFRLIPMPTPPELIEEVGWEDNLYYMTKYDLPGPPKKLKRTADTIKIPLATGYMNFLVTNKVVVQSAYWREGLPLWIRDADQESARILASVFPTRRVVLLDSRAVNIGGGGIHCITNNQPRL